MSLLYKPIDQITEADVQQLINNEVPETRVLDYKEQLTINTGDDKREFLYDITAFANSGGGELIYGVSEARINNQPSGKPCEIVGVSINNTDGLIRQLEELIRANVQPRIYGIQMKAVPLVTGDFVLIIRIPNSLNYPHMVSMGGTQRFYARNSAGKYPMDITEIRSSILSSAGISEKIRDLRSFRISNLKNNMGYTELYNTDHMLAVHLVPFSSFTDEYLDVGDFQNQIQNLWPISTTGLDFKYNFDGFITYRNLPDEVHPFTYVQLTKQGFIEAVESGYILDGSRSRKLIPSVHIEKEIIEKTTRYLAALTNLGIRPPIVLMISLIGVKGFKLGIAQNFGFQHNLIEQQDLLLPEIILEDYSPNNIASLLKPAFDSLWNAAGFRSSQNYNENGEWIGQ